MVRFGSGFVLLVLVTAFLGSALPAEAADCDAERCTIQAEIDGECPCADAINHGRYLACVTRVVNRAVREDRIAKGCRNHINGCFIRSLCGKREDTVLCDLPGDGPSGRCRPLLSDAHCTARGGEAVSTCCDACTAASPSPTPTTATPNATATPAAPAATATATGAGATPSTAETTATPTDVTATATPETEGTATPDVNATATPADVATATPNVDATTTPDVAATATLGIPSATATPAAPATATPGDGATATPSAGPTATLGDVVPTATPEAPVSTTTPEPTPSATAIPISPFVGIEADPDTGPVPLTVQWTSDVSDGTPPYSYQWDFGDGSAGSTEPNPVHVYQRVGDFTATLTVTDALGLQESDDWDVTVESE